MNSGCDSGLGTRIFKLSELYVFRIEQHGPFISALQDSGTYFTRSSRFLFFYRVPVYWEKTAVNHPKSTLLWNLYFSTNSTVLVCSAIKPPLFVLGPGPPFTPVPVTLHYSPNLELHSFGSLAASQAQAAWTLSLGDPTSSWEVRASCASPAAFLSSFPILFLNLNPLPNTPTFCCCWCRWRRRRGP